MAAALVASAVSGTLGMGGGVLLLAVLASVLDPIAVVPIHGIVQLASNFTRSLALLRNVAWGIVGLYAITMPIGAWFAVRVYEGAGTAWFKPAIGALIATFLLWDRFKPERLELPKWVFVPAGVLGGFLTVTVGAAGPYLAAFFLRDDLERREVVATKAMIQSFGHFLKIPAFLSLGFDYGAHAGTIVPLLACVIAGTFLGTALLKRLPEELFRRVFRAVLWLLALRLLVTPWWA